MNFNQSKMRQNQPLLEKEASDSAKTTLNVPHALPALWQKRTDWETSRLQQRSCTARHKPVER